MSTNGFFLINGGLELLIVNDMRKLDDDARARRIIGQSEDLQLTVFREQRVPSPSDRVLPAIEIVGGPGTSPQLDGSERTYHMLFLVERGSRLVGMAATKEVRMKGVGELIVDYVPPLVPNSEAKGVNEVLARNLMKPQEVVWRYSPVDPTLEVGKRDILAFYSRHLRSPAASYARFTDGLGVPKTFLRGSGFRRSVAPIWVPPLTAETPEDYARVVKEPIHAFMRFAHEDGQTAASGLSLDAARRLFVGLYLIGGYTDPEKVSRREAGRLPSVVQTRASLKQVAAAYAGNVPFR